MNQDVLAAQNVSPSESLEGLGLIKDFLPQPKKVFFSISPSNITQ